MRDLLSKLDAIVSETQLNPNDPKGDYQAKSKALQDLQMDPVASKDPEIRQAIIQRKAALEKEAQEKGVSREAVDFDKIRSDAASHLKKSIDQQSDARIAKMKSDKDKEDEPFMAQVGRKIIGGVKGGVKGAYRGFTGKESIELGDAFGISFSEDLEVEAEVVGFTEDGIVIELDDPALAHLEENGISFLDGELQEGLRDPKDNPCWKGYHPVGTKKKGGRTVPNCVPNESIKEDSESDARSVIEFLKGAIESVESLKNEPDYDPEDIRFTDDLPRMKQHLQTIMTDPSPDNLADAIFDYDTEWRETMGEWADDALGELYLRLSKFRYGGEEQTDEAKYHGKEVPLGKKLPGDVKKSKVYVRKPNGNIVKVNFGDKKMRIKKSNPARRRSFRARHHCANPGPRWKARYWSCRSW